MIDIENIIRGARGPFTPKLKCYVFGVLPEASAIHAIRAFASLMKMDLKPAHHVVKHLPQLLCILTCETFHSVVLDATEAKRVDAALSPYFEKCYENVLPFGNFNPWDPQVPARG